MVGSVCQSRDGDGFSAGAVCSGDLLGHVAVNVIDVLASDTVQVLLDRSLSQTGNLRAEE